MKARREAPWGRPLRAILLAGVVAVLVAATATAGAAPASSVSATSPPHSRNLGVGISLSPSTTQPYWACPHGSCGAIVDPPAVREGGRYRLGRGGALLEGGGVGGGFDPQDLQSAYKIPTAQGAAQTVALVDAFGYSAAESDLATYRKQYGLEPCTHANGCFKKVNEKGEEANYPANNTEWEEEAALDLDMVSAACPHCHLVLVEGSTESPADLGEAVNTAARLGANEISNSYGYEETYEPWCGKARCTQYNPDYEHPGTVITASAGDSGYDNSFAKGSAPDFPATSPSVVAVGGTSLHKATNARGWSEAVWSEPPKKIGTGSGCSKSEPKPLWQTDTGCTGRMGNDVAAVAAVETPVSVYTTALLGGWGLFGGTSASSPLLAGIEAHASAFTRSLGADAFYRDPGLLFDVTVGENGSCVELYFCHAEAGYDGPTGFGTPNGAPVAAPTVETGSATASSTAATLTATVNPNGSEVTACQFEYGTTASYGSTASCSPAPGSGETAVGVTASLTALAEGTTYHFRVSATNAGGTSKGSDKTFTTPAIPTVATGSATAPTKTSATLNATVNPNGVEVSECKFEYGATPSYGSSAPCTPPPGSGTSPVAVSAAISGLSERSTYHFRVSATGPGGTSKGADQTLRTLPAPHYYLNAITEAGALPAGVKVAVLSWGALTVTPEAPSKATPTSCETGSGGSVENPEGLAGGAGRGQTQSYGAWNCESASCPAGLAEFPSGSGKFVEKEALVLPGGEAGSSNEVGGSLPWASELFEPKLGKVRSESKGVVLILACVARKSVEGGPPLGDGDGDSPQLLLPASVCSTTPLNLQAPLFERGTQIGGPLTSKLNFDAESGKLSCLGPGEKEGEQIAFTAAMSGRLKTMTFEGQELLLAK